MKKLLFLLFLFFSFFGYFRYLNALHFQTASRMIFEVPSGATAARVGQELHASGLIKSPFVFKLYLNRRGLSESIKAGRYVIPQAATLKQITEVLIAGRSMEMPVTIPEGLTLDAIGALLTEEGLTTQAEFAACVKTCSFDFDYLSEKGLEGYLFPDTYFADLGQPVAVLMGRMIETLGHKVSDEDRAAIRKSPYSFAEIMIMASIVEAEERADANRPVVAGILWKRYDNGIGLAADATIRYALKKPRQGLTREDLQVDSPYNTRKYRGLPPTPIGNPGLSSIRAAIYPEKSPYFYYLHDSAGGIHYGRTLEEHNANKRRYLGS